MPESKIFSAPMKLYLLWIALAVSFAIVGIPILSIGHSAGEQRPLILFAYLLEVSVYGLLVISMIIPIVSFKWFRKFWPIPIIIGLACVWILIAVAE